MPEFEEIEKWGGLNKSSETPQEKKTSKVPWKIIGLTTLLLVFANIAIIFFILNSRNDDKDKEAIDSTSSSEMMGTHQTKFEKYASRVSVENKPWVVGEVEDYNFHLVAKVSSEEEKQALETIVNNIFLDLSMTDIEVDPALSRASWLETSDQNPNPPILYPMGGVVEILSSGGFAIGESNNVAFGEARTKELIDKYQQILTQFGGKTENEIQLVPKKAPTIGVIYEDNKITLSGGLPDQKIINLLEESIAKVKTQDGKILYPNIKNNIKVDDTLVADFNFARLGQNMWVLYHLPKYTFEVSNGAYSITLADEIGFEPGSNELSPAAVEFAKKFTGLDTFKTRQVVITGFTDNVGSAEDNQKLSEARAQAMKKVLVDNGFNENLITTVGKGETEPIATNDTDAGKAKNRRVVFTVNPS